MSAAGIRTLYLLPHSHTDIGYSHDPVVARELHDRFLDRAIALCEQTRDYPDGARFRWTVEVWFSARHWWERRGPADHARLVACLQRGEIALGARYLNGTELYAPEDLAWELGELEQFAQLTGCCPRVALQNDVNGFPLACATGLAAAGVQAVLMGLNTTMGHSPFPRCHAFRWDLGNGRELLVWNGWIYNRLKTFCHLDRLATELPAKLAACLGTLPPDYPFDFAMTSATMGDNAGPFASLPEQVQRFNALATGVTLRLATAAEFAAVLQAQRDRLPVYRGHWPDAWTFGLGSMPQMVAAVRRTQRRLRLVESWRAHGWAHATGGSLTLDRARRALALACEHTYDSHTCSGLNSGTSDSLRQKAQVQVDAATSESVSMVLLRDHLSLMAATVPAGSTQVLVANPHPWPLPVDYRSEARGLHHFASSRQPEHLFQYDREPTFEALAAAGSYGVLNVACPPGQCLTAPIAALPPPVWEDLATDADVELTLGPACLTYSPTRRGLLAWSCPGGSPLAATAEYAALAPVHESPATPFQLGGQPDMDPSDVAWNPALRFDRGPLLGRLARLRQQRAPHQLTLQAEYADSPLHTLALMLDARHPTRLAVTTTWHFTTDPRVHAYYLALPLALPGTGACEYWLDGCGQWFAAERDQLPGTVNSFYHTYRGAAVSRSGQTVYVLSPDSPLLQCGGFTFGQLPSVPLQRHHPFLALWIYNNYWGTNFPAYSPGWHTARFLLDLQPGPFAPAHAAQLDAALDIVYLTHPVT